MYPLTVDTEAHILPGMRQVQVMAWVCERCEHVWLPRDKTKPPKVCPKCKSPYWDRPRQAKKTAAKTRGAAPK